MRTLECAIGYDSRTLPDGRRALFRHTALHMRAKTDFFERRDMITVMVASLLSFSSQSSNPRMEINSGMKIVHDKRESLFDVVFPYSSKGQNAHEAEAGSAPSYDELFDELDAIIAAQTGGKDKNGCDSENMSKVGSKHPK